MTENLESAAGGGRRRAGAAPGLEGEGGQYADGDYGEAGSVEAPADNPDEGQYPDGDYGGADTPGTAREVEGDGKPDSR